MEQLLQAKEIEPELKRLINIASSRESALAKRLEELRRWIKDKKPGLLTSKRFVMDFLLELILDVETWLNLQELTEQEKQDVFAQMTPTESYWYEFLFPQWFNEHDPKLDIWKKKMMAGQFTQADELFINVIVNEIERRGGTTLRRYIVDLSMATDIIVSGSSLLPLCVQLTTVSDELSTDKKQQWETTLRYWEIKRGLFASFNPADKIKIIALLTNEILWQSNHLPNACYAQCNIQP